MPNVIQLWNFYLLPNCQNITKLPINYEFEILTYVKPKKAILRESTQKYIRTKFEDNP